MLKLNPKVPAVSSHLHQKFYNTDPLISVLVHETYATQGGRRAPAVTKAIGRVVTVPNHTQAKARDVAVPKGKVGLARRRGRRSGKQAADIHPSIYTLLNG
jgi:hypothetical protein